MSRGGIIAIVVAVVVIVAAAAWLGLGFALGQASGPVVTEQREVAGFSKVEVSSGRRHARHHYRGRVRASYRGARERRRKDRHQRTWRRLPHRRWNWFQFGPFGDAGEITYYLTTPDLAGIELSGAINAAARV